MKVFISYNQVDKTSVHYLVQKVKQSFFDVWIDVEQMIAGDLLPEKLEEGLRNSNAIAICIGKNGISEWQNKEINAALELHHYNREFRIVPVLLPGSDEKMIPLFLKSLIRINFRDNFEDKVELDNFLRALRGKEVLAKKTSKNQIKEANNEKTKNKKAVSVALLVEDEILIVQRAETQKSGGGLWQLPGGKVNEGESSIEGAIREVEEEVGVLLEQENTVFITELVDHWVVNNSGGYITMCLFLARLQNRNTIVAQEFQRFTWVKVSELFSNKDIIYFGSTFRYLSIVRRFVTLHLPLKELSKRLLEGKTIQPRLNVSSLETSQFLYSFLSLLGFLDDKGDFTPSSTLSGNLIKMLAEWALTESAIFEANSNSKWKEGVQEKDDIESIVKFREGLFDEHKNLLGALSHRLPKALSTRHVCDVLITGLNPENSKLYLLIRWDFLASKFQIPAKGLEALNASTASIDAPKYVIRERFHEDLLDKFDYKYFNKIKSSHVGAGSLGDGPILRNFIVTIFILSAKKEFNDDIVDSINRINEYTINLVKSEKKLGETTKRILNFYIWAELDYLEIKEGTFLGRKLQGFKEIKSEFGSEFIKLVGNPVILGSKNKIPLIDSISTENYQQLDFITKDY